MVGIAGVVGVTGVVGVAGVVGASNLSFLIGVVLDAAGIAVLANGAVFGVTSGRCVFFREFLFERTGMKFEASSSVASGASFSPRCEAIFCNDLRGFGTGVISASFAAALVSDGTGEDR